jgi:hypothetical protein
MLRRQKPISAGATLSTLAAIGVNTPTVKHDPAIVFSKVARNLTRSLWIYGLGWCRSQERPP